MVFGGNKMKRYTSYFILIALLALSLGVSGCKLLGLQKLEPWCWVDNISHREESPSLPGLKVTPLPEGQEIFKDPFIKELPGVNLTKYYKRVYRLGNRVYFFGFGTGMSSQYYDLKIKKYVKLKTFSTDGHQYIFNYSPVLKKFLVLTRNKIKLLSPEDFSTVKEVLLPKELYEKYTFDAYQFKTRYLFDLGSNLLIVRDVIRSHPDLHARGSLQEYHLIQNWQENKQSNVMLFSIPE